MTTSEMHVMFRQYTQQMGMQNVRAILPEQIDLLLNTSVMDVVNQIIKENIGITNDRVITDNSKIGQINALRSLYKVELIDMSPIPPTSNKETRVFHFFAEDRNTGRMTTNFIKSVTDAKMLPNYMFLVDFSLNYKKVNTGYSGKGIFSDYRDIDWANDSLTTNYFPVRLIDDAFLADTLNDFVLAPRLRSPIIVSYNIGTTQIFDIYIDKFKQIGSNTNVTYALQNNLLPYRLRMSYIGTPNKIKYLSDLGTDNVDCDLPEYMHIDIVKHAVDLYRIAVSGSIMGAQAQEKAAQQENMRNNYRNEGNTN